MSKRVLVIGAGFAGLAVAIRLAARGHQVTLVEKQDKPGGRAYVFNDSGFTFDAGPTVITAPWLITELFELAGERAEEHIMLVPVNPFYRIFFHDGDSFDYTGDTNEMAESIRAFSSVAADGNGYTDFLDWTRRIFAKGFTDLADKPFLSPLDMVKVAPDLTPSDVDDIVEVALRHQLDGLIVANTTISRPVAELPQRVRLRLSLREGRTGATGVVVPPAAGRRQPVPDLQHLHPDPLPGT